MESLWKGGMLLQGEIAHPCQTLQIISPSLPEDLKAADISKRIGVDTWPFSVARRKSLARKNRTCSARVYKGKEEGLEEFRAICKTNTAVSAQPVQLASIAVTRGHAEGVTSSMACARCHHNSSRSKGDIQNECPEDFLVDAERFTPLQAGNRTEHAKLHFTVSLADETAKGSEQSLPPECTLQTSARFSHCLIDPTCLCSFTKWLCQKAIQSRRHICFFSSLTPRKILCNQLAKSKSEKHLHPLVMIN